MTGASSRCRAREPDIARRRDPQSEPSHGDSHAVWHVYTDGSSRHERRQTFSGWAARAVQPATRQVRQISGAQPGGTSLNAETQAVLAGLQLVPAGATAWLFSDLDPQTLLELLRQPEAEAARHHLHELWVHPIARNSNRQHQDVHRVARAAETDLRGDPEPTGSGLTNAAQDMQELARAADADLPLALHAPWRLPGTTAPLQLEVLEVSYRPLKGATGQVQAELELRLGNALGIGRSQNEALSDALGRAAGTLGKATLVNLHIPPALIEAAIQGTQDMGTVRVVPTHAPPDAPAQDLTED